MSSTDLQIFYPTGFPTINILDTVEAAYSTPWSVGANMSMVCSTSLNSGQSVYTWYPQHVTTSGIFKWIIPDYSAMTSHIAQFPTLCWFWLSGPFGASDSEAETLNSGNFTMLSTSGPAKTWAASTTFASSFPTTASSTMAASTTTPGASGSGVSGSAAATSPIHTPSPPPTPVNGGGLSQGAKAAIGVGVAAIFVLALAFVYIFLLRRRLSGLQRQLHSRQMNQNTPTQRFDRPEGMHNINPMYSLRMEANDPEVIHENPARGIYEKDNDTLRRQY